MGVVTLAKQLIVANPGKFSDDFEQNKKVVKDIMPVFAKHFCNMIAGKITALMRRKRR